MQTADDIVNELSAMVSLPAVALRVCELADDPATTAADLGRVIGQDTALTARLLRVANSPALGMTRKIDTVSRAATVLGISAVRDLALGVSTAHSFDGIPIELVTMQDFWTHGMLCAAAARELTSRTSAKKGAESAFVAGLMHDVGQLVLFKAKPDESRQALLMLADDPDDLTLDQCEQRIIGFTHCEVGAALARRWRLPDALQACIEFHHAPDRASAHEREVAIVHIANSVATLAEIQSTDLDDAEPVTQSAWSRVGLDPGCLGDVLVAVHQQMTDVRSLLQ
jgi:HD-like signal output (HDOD) protein